MIATPISDTNSVGEGRRPASSKTNYVDKLDDLTKTPVGLYSKPGFVQGTAMGRPAITFTSDEWRAIAAAATFAHEAAPHHANSEFLDQFIAGVARTTGQLYGQTLYERMLSAVGIHRRPSGLTWSKAIRRAREAGLPEPRPRHVHEAGEPIAPPPAASPGPLLVDERSDEIMDLRVRVEVSEMALRDAYARLARYDAECTTVGGRAMSAEAQVRELTQQLERERAEHGQRTAELVQRLDALTAAIQRMAGLENHMRMQTDNLRQQMSEQSRYWKGRAEALDKALADERIKADAMRRVLGNRIPPSV
ncbi:hypothetical protein [Burkholderia anthina]|uniref:hypothetical protein n=1 Tax=Burkholderia anthina TaxID=179879 RepID=UPI00158C8D3D|nr:hypothetical protein [Burkholderia anthina]